MIECKHCNSIRLIKKGTESRKGFNVQRYKCMDCGKPTVIPITLPNSELIKNDVEPLLTMSPQTQYNRSHDWIADKTKKEIYVITSAQSNTDVDFKFLHSLENYCKVRDGQLLIIPIKYKNPTSQNEDTIEHNYDSSLSEYLFTNNIRIHEKLKLLGALKIAATTEYPLTGLAPITKGDSIIIGHNQLQCTTLPVQPDDFPVIMTTTGTVSKRNYSESKQGYKAEFNHSNSAVIVELDGDIFHIRHLNFDGDGFFDLENYYLPKEVILMNKIHSIVTGDEHVMFACELVKVATYGVGGIVNTLNPSYIVRHDILDCFSISHHHKKNFLIKYSKALKEQNNVEKELLQTVNYIVDTTPEFSTNIIVASNHNDHLTKWLNECDPKLDVVNAKLYHLLMYKTLEEIDANDGEIPNPFKLYADEFFADTSCAVQFTSRSESIKFFDIEMGIHGDRGVNGARGSRDQFSKLPSKTIIGHSHSPGIEKGCYQTGTSSVLKLEYNDGPSSWLNTHCVIYPNGKRQLINIIKGKWRKWI